MTNDQLSYILERKYTNIRPHQDFNVATDTSHTTIDGIFQQHQGSAYILEWNIKHIECPTVPELHKYWDMLESQYQSDPDRPDSEMFAYLHNRPNIQPPIFINDDI